MGNYDVQTKESPRRYNYDVLGYITLRAVHEDELTRCIALRECITLFIKSWFEIMQIDQFDPGCSTDPMGSGDLTASMSTELDMFAEFYDSTIRGKCRVVGVSEDYIALLPMWSLAKIITERLAFYKDREPLMVMRRGPAAFQPTAVYSVTDIDWAVRNLLSY